MTLINLLIKTGIFLTLLTVFKILFFNILNIEVMAILILYYVAIFLLSIAVVRRLGDLSYLEDFLVMGVWLIGALIIDLFITDAILGKDMWKDLHYWLSYPVFLLTIFLFHKKQHVAVRKAMRS